MTCFARRQKREMASKQQLRSCDLLLAAILVVLPMLVFTQTTNTDQREKIGPLKPVKVDTPFFTVVDEPTPTLKSDKAVNGAGQTCGQSMYSDAGSMNLPSPRIVGGQQARSYEFPWQAKLIITTRNGSFFCGGSVLNDRWVVTAAHCVSDETGAMIATSVQVGFGDNRRQYARQLLYVTPSDIHVHPSYDADYIQNDICLLRMNGTILLDQLVAPVCLPPDATNQYAWGKAVISGWGRLSFTNTVLPTYLQYTTLNITSNSYCSRYWSIISGEVCTVDNTGNYDRAPCKGDSGGPLVVQESDRTFYLVGVTSYGSKCANGYPSVFTRVSSYLNFIYGWIGFPAASTTTSTSTTSRTSTSTTTTRTSTTTTTTTPPTTTTIPVLACANMELVFIVDASLTSSSTCWQSILSFVNSVIDRFTISQSSVRIAFVRYAANADVQFYLNWYSDKNYIKQLVSSISLIGGTTSNLDRALDLVRTSVFNNARQNTWEIAIFITDRLPYSQQVLTAANNAKSAGILLYGVGIYGPGLIDFSTFYQLPTDSVYYTVSSCETLTSASYYASYFAQSACKTSTPTTATTTTTTTSRPTTTTSTTRRTTTSTTPPTTTTTVPVLACANMELVFIVDASSKSSSTGWQSMLSFVNSVIDRFTISQSSVRVAFVRYAADADVQFYLNWYSDKNYIKQLVSSISLIGGSSSNVDRGIDLARSSVFSGSRQGVWKVAVLLTEHLDTASNQQVITSVNNAKAAGIQLIPVGVNVAGLTNLCSFYDMSSDQQFYVASDYNKLNSVSKRIANFACMSGSPPVAGSAPATTSTSTSTTTTTAARINTFFQTFRATPAPSSGSYCSVTNIELVFVVDSSSKSDSSAWTSMLTFVNSVINKFNVAQNAVRVAFVRYSNQPTVVFNLHTYNDRNSIQAAVSAVQYVGGSSEISSALNVARTQVLSSSNVRPNALKIIVTVTDQLYATSVNGLSTAINNCRSAGIRMYAAGINYVSGHSLDSDAVYQLSFNSDQSNPWQATWVYGYSDLPNRVTQLAQYACVGGTLP